MDMANKLSICRSRLGLLAMVLASGLLAATPTLAADNIECMDSPFAASEQAAIDDWSSSFALNAFSESGAPQAVVAAIAARTEVCTEEHGWSQQAAEYALLYKVMRLAGSAMEESGFFSADQWAELRRIYSEADKAVLARVLVPMLDSAMAGSEADPAMSAADEQYLGELVIRSGIPPTNENAEFIGAWVATQAGQAVLIQRFGEQ